VQRHLLQALEVDSQVQFVKSKKLCKAFRYLNNTMNISLNVKMGNNGAFLSESSRVSPVSALDMYSNGIPKKNTS
jgi:hypothetical protein